MKNIHMFGSEGSWGRFVYQNNAPAPRFNWKKEVVGVGDTVEDKLTERKTFYDKIGKEKQTLKDAIDKGKLQKEHAFTGELLSVQLAKLLGEPTNEWSVKTHRKTFDVLNRITKKYPEYNVDNPDNFKGKKLVIKEDGTIEIVDVKEEVVVVPVVVIPETGDDNGNDDLLNNKEEREYLKRIKELEDEVRACTKGSEECTVAQKELDEYRKSTEAAKKNAEEMEQEVLKTVAKALFLAKENVHWNLEYRKNQYEYDVPLFRIVGDGINAIITNNTMGGSKLIGRKENGLDRRNICVLTKEDLKRLDITKEEASEIINKVGEKRFLHMLLKVKKSWKIHERNNRAKILKTEDHLKRSAKNTRKAEEFTTKYTTEYKGETPIMFDINAQENEDESKDDGKKEPTRKEKRKQRRAERKAKKNNKQKADENNFENI